MANKRKSPLQVWRPGGAGGGRAVVLTTDGPIIAPTGQKVNNPSNTRRGRQARTLAGEIPHEVTHE